MKYRFRKAETNFVKRSAKPLVNQGFAVFLKNIWEYFTLVLNWRERIFMADCC